MFSSPLSGARKGFDKVAIRADIFADLTSMNPCGD